MGMEPVAILAVALLIDPEQSGWTFILPLFVYGVGVGLASAQLTSVILSEVPTRESGQASGMQSTFRQVGAAIGIALLGTVLSAGLRSGTIDNLATIPDLPPVAQEGIVEAVAGSAGQVLPALAEQPGSEAVVAAVSDAFASAAQSTGFVAVAFVFLGFVLSTQLPDIRYTDRRTRSPAEQ